MSVGAYVQAVLFRSGPLYDEVKRNEKIKEGHQRLDDAYGQLQSKFDRVRQSLSSPSLNDYRKVELFASEAGNRTFNALEAKFGRLTLEHIREVQIVVVAHTEYMYRLYRARQDLSDFNAEVEKALAVVNETGSLPEQDKERLKVFRLFLGCASKIVSDNAKNHDESLKEFLKKRFVELRESADFDPKTGKLTSVKNVVSVYEVERAAIKIGVWMDGETYKPNEHVSKTVFDENISRLKDNLGLFLGSS